MLVRRNRRNKAVLGEHDNVGSDVVIAHRTHRSSAEVDDVEEEDDDDLIAEVVDEVVGDLALTGEAREDDAAEAIAAEFSPQESTTSSTSTSRQGQRRGQTTSRRRAAVHLTPISRPEIDSVVSVTNHRRDALATKLVR